MDAPARVTAALARFLNDERVPWKALSSTSADVLDACTKEGVTGLVHQKLRRCRTDIDWPEELRNELARDARAEAARELLRQREIIAALDALAAAGLHPILLKGTPLAYSLYDPPSSRSRVDTDLLIPLEEVDTVRSVMTRLGYAAATICGGELLFCQFVLIKTDRLGVYHGFDVHWKISTQSVFADVLTYDELAAQSAPIVALGQHARAPGSLHALILACIHPVMHHRNAGRLIWIHDVHLLASRFSGTEFDRLVDLAIEKQLAAAVEHGLALARSHFDTAIPSHVMNRLAARRTPEPSAAYLRAGRYWHHELISNLIGLPRWRDRFTLLREVMLPEPGYMFTTYGIAIRPAVAILLPLLYLHRGLHGAWKVLSGRK